MRSNPADYELLAPENLQAVVSLLAQEPGKWTPIAGGTDLMVLYSAGKLANRKLLSLWNLPELRRIDVSQDEIRIGAGCTYTDLQENEVVQKEFPLLARAASWTGGIANQNRGTLGGNIVNASPAADSLPALLVYEAELILASARGERRMPYVDFHTGYKKTLLAPDELIRAIVLQRRFAEYVSYSRKIGARNVQAISKVCVAALARLAGFVIEDVRIAAGSVAPIPIRLRATELFLKNNVVDSALVQRARHGAMKEVSPIGDIRSTAEYRAAVLGNLVAEFLLQLAPSSPEVQEHKTTATLDRWNRLSISDAAEEILSSCGSVAWAHQLAAGRPFADEASLIKSSDEIWNHLTAQDWIEAFSKHPRIGERKAPLSASEQSVAWSAQEQKSVSAADEEVQKLLVEGNRKYEARFGRIFIVCATGKSAVQMLDELRHRLHNDEATELREAAEEQRKITNIRLKKWLQT
jgi:OHCU decarboxylase